MENSEIADIFSYNEDTGELKKKKRPLHHFNSERAWKISNSKTHDDRCETLQTNRNGKSYLKVSFGTKNGKVFLLAHRVAWFLFYGEWPDKIDHINGNGCDNRIKNLRSVTTTENNRNMKLFKTNSSGVTGVYKVKDRWNAMIWCGNKQINLGVFDTKDEAVAARKGAEKANGYHINHGEDRNL
jgi:hypothetical protein